MSDLFTRLVANSVRTMGQSAVTDPFAEAPSVTPTEHRESPDSALQASDVPGSPNEVEETAPEAVGVRRQSSRRDGIVIQEQPALTPVEVASDRAIEDRHLTTIHQLSVAQAIESLPHENAAHVAPFTTKAGVPTETPTLARSSEDEETPRSVVDAHVRTSPAILTHAVGDVAPPDPIDSQPTVQIHIGRLEVRTNLDKPSPKQRVKESEHTATDAKPTLSLDDYLSGRKAAR